MAQRKSERLMNLVIALLMTRQFLTKEHIRDSVTGYRGEDIDSTAFERMFERDKKELRELGINVETGSNDVFFEDEVGYRIRRDTFELQDIQFTTQEAAVVGLAAQVWQHAGLASQSSDAIVKLKAAGIEVDVSALSIVEPQLSADEPAFDAMWEAATARRAVTFDYQRPGHETLTRRLQPWGLVSWHGRWYVAGFDLDREATRVFRLSRVEGEVTTDARSGSYEIPADVDLRSLAQALFPAPQTKPATVRVRSGRCQDLRRRAETVTAVDSGWDEIMVKYGFGWQLAAEIASYGPDAIAVGPAEIKDEVVARLQRALQSGISA